MSFDTGIAPSYVAIVSCIFSCLGSFLIVLTFFLLKDMRTGSQKIITLLAIADLTSAVGYIVGSANYLHHRHLTSDCGNFKQVCVGQATVTTYSSLVSFLLTVILAFYFFLIIIFKRVQVASKLMILYNVVAWGGPLVIVVPLLALGKLGYSHFAASNWCYVSDDGESLSSNWLTTVIILIAGKLWEILSYIIVSVLYAIITVHIGKTRRLVRNTLMEPRVVHVETRLLLIPVIFILLRIWGTLQFFFSIATSDKITNEGCVPGSINMVFKVLAILQAIGDGGQGWGNAILYIFLSPVIRERLIGEWCGRLRSDKDDRLNGVNRNDTQRTNSVQIRGQIRGVERRGEEETTPMLGGTKAAGYDIRRYNTTTTEGFLSGSDDISLTP